jgi:hypothetical protein
MSTDQSDDFNARADFYHRQWGINIIPAPTTDKLLAILGYNTLEDTARRLVLEQQENAKDKHQRPECEEQNSGGTEFNVQ